MAQQGFIFRKGDSWFLKYRDDVIEGGEVRRKQQCKRLAPVCDPIPDREGFAGPER